MKFEKIKDGEYRLDVCGYVCPHPQLYTKKALEKISESETLEVIFDNPSSGETITQMCEQGEYEIIKKTKEGPVEVYIIKKS